MSYLDEVASTPQSMDVAESVALKGISKGRQGREAQNVIRVYLANLRFKVVGADVLITAYEPILIKFGDIFRRRMTERALLCNLTEEMG